MISAKIIADSVNPAGARLTSWLLTYPRFIHSEFMTHRVFSRNAASSRAIPFVSMLRAVRSEPALPERWGAEQAGMQSGEEIPHPNAAQDDVEALARTVSAHVELLKIKHGFHKSIANRYLEPWAHMTVLATATDHSNFFALRAHPAAMPEFQVLAYRMLALYLGRQPQQLQWGEWHIPKFDGMQEESGPLAGGDFQLKIATARCARLSYLTFDGKHDIEKDIELHDRLAEAGHWSPFEHCAQAVVAPSSHVALNHLSNFDVNGRLSHWRQYRKSFENECASDVDLAGLMLAKPEWIEIESEAVA